MTEAERKLAKDDAKDRHGQLTKLLGNVNRAKTELNRRNEIRNIALAGTIGVTGTLVGILVK